MIPGILASWPFGDPPNPGPPPTPSPAAPGTFTTAQQMPNFPTSASGLLCNVAYDDVTGIWYAGGGGNTAHSFYISFDRGVTWQQRSVVADLSNAAVLIAKNGVALMAGPTGTGFKVYRSTDNFHTTSVYNFTTANRFNYNGSQDMNQQAVAAYVAGDAAPTFSFFLDDGNITTGYRFATSIDGGVTWSLQGNGSDLRNYPYGAAVRADNMYILASYDRFTPTEVGKTYQSHGSIGRTQTTTGQGQRMRLTNGNGMWLAMDTTGVLYSSTDTLNGSAWTTITPVGYTPGSSYNIRYGNGYFLIVSNATASLLASTDGVNWSSCPDLPFVPSSMTFGGDRWIITDNNGNYSVYAF